MSRWTIAELAAIRRGMCALGHTAAWLAISFGANVKAMQRVLRHASAAMTLDTDADLFDDDLDAVASKLNDAMSRTSQLIRQPRAVRARATPQEIATDHKEPYTKPRGTSGNRVQ